MKKKTSLRQGTVAHTHSQGLELFYSRREKKPATPLGLAPLYLEGSCLLSKAG